MPCPASVLSSVTIACASRQMLTALLSPLAHDNNMAFTPHFRRRGLRDRAARSSSSCTLFFQCGCLSRFFQRWLPNFAQDGHGENGEAKLHTHWNDSRECKNLSQNYRCSVRQSTSANRLFSRWLFQPVVVSVWLSQPVLLMQ